MSKPFFEGPKMPKDDKKVKESKELDARQKKLVSMLIPIVQEYFKTDSTKRTEDVKVAIKAKIKEIEDMLVDILAAITQEQNRKMPDSIESSDDKKVKESKTLDADQKKLVAMMIPLVQEYFKTDSTLRTEDVKVALEAKVEEIDGILVDILAEITKVQNKNLSNAIGTSEANPYFPY